MPSAVRAVRSRAAGQPAPIRSVADSEHVTTECPEAKHVRRLEGCGDRRERPVVTSAGMGAGDSTRPLPRHRVALVLLPPLPRRGLAVGLAEAGLEVEQPDDLALWASSAEGPLLVLGPDGPALTALLDGLAARVPDLLSVALLDQPSLPAYARALARHEGAVPLAAEVGEIVTVVQAACGGRVLLPAGVARLLVTRGAGPEARPRLEPREAAWLRALSEDRTVDALARAAGMSEREMYRRLASVYQRLGATGRAQALVRAQRFGLLDPAAR